VKGRDIVIISSLACAIAAWQAPVANIPIVGGISYYANGHGDGNIVIGISIVVLLFAVFKVARVGLIGGIGVGAMLAFFASRLQSAVDQGHAAMNGNMFGGLGNAIIDQVRLEWGFWVMVAAAVGMFHGGLIANRDAVATIETTPEA
jgi:hypothetical protein